MLDLKIDGDTLLVRVNGDLDLVVAKVFKDRIDEVLTSRGAIQNLMIDLSRVKFIDSSGLGVIIGRYKVMKARGGNMAMCGVSSNVYRILEISGIRKLMPVLKAEDAPIIKGGKSC